MGQDKGDVTIAYSNNRPTWSPDPPTRMELEDTDWFDVKGVSWPAELAITAIQFFDGPQETRTNLIGEWKKGDPANKLITKVVNGVTVNCFKVTGNSDNDVKIEDAENSNSVNDTFYYKIHIERGGSNPGDWWLDPQVINKKNG